MKTKPFLLATAGSTVDGRVIDEKMMREMAESYDPKTYGARLNIEHIRGISGEKPFRSYGDVLELTTAEVDVNMNGSTEKRLGLFGSFDITDDAKALNDAGQKVYSSIEIEPNFGGKGFAYLMGCALTDSPASIATERLQFNRQMPGTIKLSRDISAALEFADDKPGEDGGTFLAGLKGILDGFVTKLSSTKPEEKPTPPAGQEPAAPFDMAAFGKMMETSFGAVAKEITAIRTEFRAENDALAVRLKNLADEREQAPARDYSHRPKAAGQNGQFAKTDC